MDLELLEFDIESLNGKKNFHLKFKDSILILVGGKRFSENNDMQVVARLDDQKLASPVSL